VRVVGPDAEQLGILPIDQALARAQDLGMDLVEVSPMAKPPVCKIMDYGKFKYTEKKKQNEAKKKQVVVQLKEVKLRPRTEEHDYNVKIGKIREFVHEANKARVTVMFRGREITHRELGQKVLQRVIEDVKDVAVIEQAPRMEGRQMFMILAPNPKMLQRQRDQAKAKEALATQNAARSAAAPGAAAATPEAAPPAQGAPAAQPPPEQPGPPPASPPR
jgi:translation initiation factor IF-3